MKRGWLWNSPTLQALPYVSARGRGVFRFIQNRLTVVVTTRFAMTLRGQTMNRPSIRVGIAILILGLSGCAAGSTDAQVAAAGGDLPQFFLGLWHGFIAPITLIVEIINRLAPHLLPWRPRFFETGTGVAYDLGFYLTLSGGPHFVLYSWRRNRQ